jgi:polysaccharide transporter, PST family
MFRIGLAKKLSFLKQKGDLQKIILNAGWLFSDRVLRMAASLFVGAWVARYLGTEQFGLLNYAVAWVGLFAPIASLGIENLVVRDLVANPARQGEILGTTFWLKLCASAVSVILAVGSIYAFQSDESLAISLVAILSLAGFFRTADTIDLWFQSQFQSKYTVIAKNSAFMISSIVKIAMINLKAPLIAFAWVALGEVAGGAIGLWSIYRQKKGFKGVWRWHLPLAKALFQEGWPLLFSALSIMVYMKIDAIMLKQMVSDRAVGLYSAAVKISEVWYFIPAAITASVSPAIFAAKQLDEALYYQRIKQLMRLLVAIAVIIAIPMTFISQMLVNILFGNDYNGAGLILATHIWSSIFVFIGGASQPWFIAEGLTKMTLYQTLLGAIINVGLNLFLIPKYAGIGAAVATVIAYAVSSVFANATLRKTRPIFKIQIQSLLLFR